MYVRYLCLIRVFNSHRAANSSFRSREPEATSAMFSFQHLCQGATAFLFSFITYRHRLDPVSTTQYIQTHPPARCGGCRFLKSQFLPWFLLCSFAICLRALFSVLAFILFAFKFESDAMKPLLTTHVSITTPSSTFLFFVSGPTWVEWNRRPPCPCRLCLLL